MNARMTVLKKHFLFGVVVSLAFGAGLVVTSSMASATVVRTVALSGQQAPGTSSGAFGGFNAPALNSSGQTAFLGALSCCLGGVTTNNDTGIWSEGSGILALVAREGSSAPGTGAAFGELSVSFPTLNAAGQVSFSGPLTGAGVTLANNVGMWSGLTGSLGLVARKGSQAPGTPAGVDFNNLGVNVLNDAGQVAFRGTLTGVGVNSTNNEGIWAGDAGNLTLVARAGDQAPDRPAGVNFASFTSSAINALGQIAFYASDSSSNEGIWSGFPGSLALVAGSGAAAPGTGADFQFMSNFPVLNAAGKTAFSAFITGGGVNFTNDEGIWSEGSGNLALIAREGNPAPGTSLNFSSLGDPVLNAAGKTAFWAFLTDFSDGIWTETSGGLALVARAGSQAAGTPGGVNYSFFDPPVMNGAGQIAFRAELTGGDVDGSNDVGIWATDLDGTLQLVARKGDQLEVAPSVFRTINFLEFFANTGNEDGHRSGFNDLGQLGFLAHFTDGSSGVFVSDLVAVDGSLQGDFNNDGTVDAADYVVWRKTDGGPDGYDDWRANFSNTLPGNAASGNAAEAVAHVPEPSSMLLLALGGVALIARRPNAAGTRRSP